MSAALERLPPGAPRALLRAAGLAFDGLYLAAWWLAPGAGWAPWVIAAGLALATAAILRANADAPPRRRWSAFCLPLLLPVTGSLTPPPYARRPRGARRLGLGLALAGVVAACATGLLEQRVAAPMLAPLDAPAAAYVDRALLQAGGAYVGARALERLLAVAGDISIGIGFVEGRPGQVFEPLRDLLDRFSTVVLAALASLTLQKVLLELGGEVALALFGTAAALLAAGAVLAGERHSLARSLGSAAGLLLGTAVLLRLLLPLTGIGVSAIAGQVLDERERAATATIERAAGRVGLDVTFERAPGGAPPPPGSGPADAPTLGERMGKLKDQAQALQAVDQGWLDSVFGALVDLVAVFVIETLIAPLAVLLLFWRLWRHLATGMGGPPRAGRVGAAP